MGLVTPCLSWNQGEWWGKQYRKVGALEFLHVSDAAGDNDALCISHLHAEGHDAAADGVCLAGGLLHHHKCTRFCGVAPVRVLGDVWLWFGENLALGGEQNGGHGRNG